MIRKVHNSGELNTQFKDSKDDPVTIADFTVQKTIEFNIKKLYPSLTILGEEDPKNYAHISPTVTDIDELIKSAIGEELLQSAYDERKAMLESSIYSESLSENPLSFSTENATLIVDPLDGTKDYVEGRIGNVT